MPSITYWNRLEPRPRARDLAPSLAARVRDPLWFLARQYQMGEFDGEDAGSPAFVRLSMRQTPFTAWRVNGGPPEPIDGSTPLEELVEAEAYTDHLGMKVELGQLAETVFVERGLQTLITQLRRAYLLSPSSEEDLARSPDTDAARFQRVAGGRAIDGVMLFREAEDSAPDVPPRLTVAPAEIPESDRDEAAAALAAFRADVRALYEAIGAFEAPAWYPERLEFRIQTIAAMPDGQDAILRSDPGSDGDFDWYAFDLETTARPESDEARPETVTTSRSVLPVHTRFTGMPNHRWWDFETGLTDFGAVEPDRRDLARMLVVDFMLIAGNDWFEVPVQLPVGALCQIDVLIVHDVFGGTMLVPRADTLDGGSAPGWSMFSTAWGDGVAPFFLMPPSAGPAVQVGPLVEEVRFLRDEMANMVWGIEQTLENGLGQGFPGQERAQAVAALASATAPGAATAAALRYLLETLVPENWIPFLPVAIDPARGDVALERAAIIRARPDGSLFAVEPRGRILTPPGVSPYRIREEEVTRAGTRVSRAPMRSRWVDGSTHLWIARRKGVGAGEGWSGLRYDLAVGKSAER
jgi:hypothetical protein